MYQVLSSSGSLNKKDPNGNPEQGSPRNTKEIYKDRGTYIPKDVPEMRGTLVGSLL